VLNRRHTLAICGVDGDDERNFIAKRPLGMLL
jgi:hypothetical protein